MTKRKHYTKKIRLDAVYLITLRIFSRSEAARWLSVNSNMMVYWEKS